MHPRFEQVRLQTRTPDAPKNMSGTFVHIVKTDGIRGLYSGISASLLRQLTYSTARFGIYEEMKQRAGPDPSFPVLIAMACTSGFAGGIAGNFADVLNVRMQHDAALPPTSAATTSTPSTAWPAWSGRKGSAAGSAAGCPTAAAPPS